ncbi:hypothetical protein DPMN_138661 [Dreissena polymorpha]|uniref:Uncharacterized protein n=1 Tax=Dreissena polymorpha TaxID=45954 RepID=A0A9D4G4P3_DREPO|nr:hypothetical protein DPMN_138661 [Dreissena polymorpha]
MLVVYQLIYPAELQGSRWAQILGRSDFSLDTDLGRMERLGHKGLHKTGRKQIPIRGRLEKATQSLTSPPSASPELFTKGVYIINEILAYLLDTARQRSTWRKHQQQPESCARQLMLTYSI